MRRWWARTQEDEVAAPTYNKKGFGFHPLWSFVNHGAAGTVEPLSVLLRPRNAGSNTATDHIAVIKAALAQLPPHRPGKRAGRKVLTWMNGQRLSYSVGFPLHHNTTDLLNLIPPSCGHRPTTPKTRSATAHGSPS